ncbi:hypothetical protein NG99_09475 [Erwinia typographi]|uniref:DUF202 domain-containing protein n=1 Tax=Erwinia typographi TaxID=371042 RepID=A0A0A3Z5K9_9GAMM|nr:DUF202 domain-containing protein [Erwinia typographi]KGT94372.1 hypothetical protein NG99_09475 [Erwinia typographi]
MPARRRARRLANPGLQPERTSLAWFRTLLGCGVLMALALRHQRQLSSVPFGCVMILLFSLWLLLCGYARQRGKIDEGRSDFAGGAAQAAKLGITCAVMVLALLFSSHHLAALFTGGQL